MFPIQSFHKRTFQIGAMSLFLLSGQTAHAATFTVTNTSNDGTGSLREAISNANSTSAADTIQFNIAGEGVQTIRPNEPLPPVMGPVTIDARTQPGYTDKPLIELSGENAGAFASGFEIFGNSSQILGFIINRFAREGVSIHEFSSERGSHTIGLCYIGTDASGAQALPNGGRGVRIEGASNNLINSNLISGNRSHGIYIRGSRGNTISNNRIGTNAAGTAALGNADGIRLELGAQNNLIGSRLLDSQAREGSANFIAGNGLHGVSLFGGATSGNQIAGNVIGVDPAAPQGAPGNGGDGIHLESAPNNSIGNFVYDFGLNSNGNTISGNRRNGILLFDRATKNNTVIGNRIFNNGGDGVGIVNGIANTLGGTNTGLANFIYSNGDCGVKILGNRATLNVLLSNFIGTDRSGQNLGNADDGVQIVDASNNTIGSSQREFLNTIAFNGGEGSGGNGVVVFSGRQNQILINHIYANTRLGINLGDDGVTANDGGDSDGGANDRLNFPDLDLAVTETTRDASGASQMTTQVQGRYSGLPNTNFKLFFFASQRPNNSGYGEGQRYMGFLDIKTDATGNVDFVFRSSRLGFTAAVGEVVSATTFNGTIGTSEFSRAIKVLSDATAPTITITSPTNGATLSTFPRIEGTYGDNRRVERIEVFIQRRSDKKYFDGEGWVVTAPRFRAEARNERLWRYNGTLPSGAQLRPDTYQILAIAFDASGNRGQAISTIRIVGGGQST